MPMSYENVDKMSDSLVRACSDMNVIVRDTLSASLQSVTILTKGCEELCDTMSSLMQRSIESSAQASRAMMTSKNINDVMETQSTLVKSGFDNAMMEMNRFMQMSSRLAQQVAEPVTQNMNAAFTKMTAVKVA